MKFPRVTHPVAHCPSREGAEKLLHSLGVRFSACGLELHPDKTRIVYCKDDTRRGKHPEMKFDFLGYTFRPRSAKNKNGKLFTGFLPAVSNKSKKEMRKTIRSWHVHLLPGMTIEDLSRMFNPIIRGWVNYYGSFYKSELYPVFWHLDRALVRWVRQKYKKLYSHQRRAINWLGKVARREPKLFVHWQMGILPSAG